MIGILNIETSVKYEMESLHKGASWPVIVFRQWTDATKKVFEDWMDGVYTMQVCTDKAYQNVIMALTEADGLEVIDHEIFVSRDESQNVLDVRKYFFRIVCDAGGDRYQLIHGTINVDY